MSGTIVVDRIESDASYASSINIASPVIISNTTNFTSNVGIGTSSPTTKLHVAGTGTQGITVERTDASTAGVFQLLSGNSTNVINASTAKPISFEINSAEVARFTETGGYLRMASGTGGIQFGGDTAAANALDDYEEGTWTPDLRFGGGTTAITYAGRGGRYTKVGNVVYFTMRITLSNKGSSTGAAQIFGLPFLVGSTGNFADYSGASLAYSGNTVGWNVTLQPTLDTNNSYIYMRYNNGTGSVDMTNGNFANNTDVILFGFYFA